MDTPHEPAPRSSFEVNAPRLLGRASMLGGAACAVGGFIGVSHFFEADSPRLASACIALAVFGFFLIYAGARSLSALTPDEPRTGFVAWGRLIAGAVVTVIAVAARIVVRYFPDAPPEAVVPPAMLLIAGPVLLAWASYATFILDADQADTGLLLIGTFLALIPVLFML